MATKGDIEDVNGSLSEPFVDHRKREAEEHCSSDNGGSMMVYISTFIASCGSFQFGYCVGYSSPAQFSIMKDLDETSSEYSIFGSILTVGAIVGALTCGHTADSAGRKGAMGIASIICILGWIAIYIAPGALVLDFGRFLTGYGIGNISYVVPVYVAEITPKDLRGLLATVNLLLVVTGLAVAYAIGVCVSWRTLALTGLFFIPESPRWLREFEAALTKLRGPGADISTEQADIEDSLVIIRQLPKIKIPDLLSGRNIRLISLMAFQQLVGINGINYYAAEIFKSAGVSPSVGSILYSSTQVVVTAIGATLMDRAGRRPLLMISVSGLFIGNLLIGRTSFAPDLTPILALGGSLVYIASFSMGMGTIPWVLMSELFPLNIKAIGGGLVTLINWFGSWVISYSFFYLFSWSSFALIFTIKFVPETKGRTLEEIQALMD
ncbi:hypothetical protein EZV62_006942 [Acer yangbiense]|uniref:Major facilitator superfamily (MFS) profile domain-containing protein n=1 Tax=Acer yangbiense TaxID=1000413 RepID=A0A5C7I919_9ROSI|nr:hypothetical protein EZV62_006942 [Acer yangbiense]